MATMRVMFEHSDAEEYVKHLDRLLVNSRVYEAEQFKSWTDGNKVYISGTPAMCAAALTLLVPMLNKESINEVQ